jgi:sporulation protein YlmC with PRC-barrel domain
MRRELSAELLIGRPVRALNGRRIGRLQEIELEQRGAECFVVAYLIGVYGLFERLAASDIGRSVLRALGANRKGGYRVPWQSLDLSDASAPRLRCEVSELEALPRNE